MPIFFALAAGRRTGVVLGILALTAIITTSLLWPDGSTHASLGTTERLGVDSSGRQQEDGGPVPSEKVAPAVRQAMISEPPVSVVVTLAAKRAPSSGNPSVNITALADSIAESAARVLASIPPSEFELAQQYKVVPALAGRATAAGVWALAAHPDVVHVALNQEVHANLAEAVPLINADAVHNLLGVRGDGVVVAVLDTGIDTDHPMLSDDLNHQKCFLDSGTCPGGGTTGPSAEDGDGHGSHVSGIITSNGPPVGVAPDALIDAFKVLDDSGSGSDANILAAYDEIINFHPEVDIINMSLGGAESYPPGTCEGILPALATAVATTRALGMTTFAASGNNGSNSGISYPACLNDIVSVGAVYDANVGFRDWGICADPTTAPDQVVCFSQSNISLDLLAPGATIDSTVPGGGLANHSGTSMASPMAAGAAALLLDSEPLLTPAEVETRLKETGVPVTDAGNGVTTCRVDAYEAVINDGGPVCASSGPPPSANDNFADAIVVPEPLPYSNKEDTTGATTEPGEPQPCGTIASTVWYRFTPTSDVTLVADTFGSNYDTVLAVYTGPSLDSLTLVGCNDQSFGNQSRVQFQATAGVTYHFQAGGYFGAAGNLVFNLAELLPPLKGNDNFGSAVAIPEPLPYSNKEDTTGATTEPGEPQPCGTIASTVWYRFTPTSDVTLVADTFGSNYDTVLAVYTGPSLGALTLVGCNDQFFGNQSRVQFQATAGVTYHFQVGGFFGATGNLVFNLNTLVVPSCPASPTFSWSVPDPLGDAFGFGFPNHDITSVAGEGDASTLCLTVEFAGPVDPADAGTGQEVGGMIEFDTDQNAATGSLPFMDIFCASPSGMGVEASLSLFSVSGGFGLLNGTPVPVVFDATSFTAVIPLSLIGGDSAFNVGMLLGSFSEPTDCAPANGGCIESPAGSVCPPPPTPAKGNDNFGSAVAIPEPLPYSNKEDTSGATTEPGEPQPCAGISRTVWYSYTSPVNQTLQADTSGSDYDTALAVYTGATLGSLTNAACDDDSGPGLTSLITFTATAGTTYHFQVGGFFGGTGNLVFNLGLAPTPTPTPTPTNTPLPPPKGNDHFPGAVAIPEPLPYSNKEDTAGATNEPGEPRPCGAIGRTVWYSYTSPVNQTLVADTSGSNYDTVLAVYTGPSLGTLTNVACDDDSGPGLTSLITFTATTGTTYHFQVGGFFGARGNLVFNLAGTRMPTPEMSLAVKAGAIPCPAGGEDERACVPVGGEFTLAVETKKIPSSGYIGMQTYVVYGSSLTYRPTLYPATEIVWPDLDPAIALRGPLNPTGTEGFVNHAGLTGLLPPLPVSTFVGNLVELAIACSDNPSETSVRLLPYDDPVAGTYGAGFVLPSGEPVPVPPDSLTIDCIQPPTATPTATPTPTPVPGMQKLPALQNLFLTRQGEKVPPVQCVGPQGGDDVAVFTHRLTAPIKSPDPKDPSRTQELGAFEFQVSYEQNKVCVELVPGPAAANMSCIVQDAVTKPTLEGVARIGCVTLGKQAPAPDTTTEAGRTLAFIRVRPQPDVYSQAKPNQGNGVVVQLLSQKCELADRQGHPIQALSCEDADVTIRYLESDVEPDCAIDTLDTQAIAFRWGVEKGALVYNERFNLEPAGAQADADIDIKDLQFVYGRYGSTCANPHPDQPPVNPKT